MKPPIKRINSTNSLSEHGTDGTATTTASNTSTEKTVPPPHTNGQSVAKPNGLPAPLQDPRPKKRPKPPPRPNPGASLFIPSKKVRHSLIPPYSRPYSLTALHRGNFLTQIQRDRVRDDIELLVYPGIPLFIGLATSSLTHARHSNPRQYLPCIVPHILIQLVSIALTK